MAVSTISEQIIFQNPENVYFKHTDLMLLIFLWFCSLSTDAICLLCLSNLSYTILPCVSVCLLNLACQMIQQQTYFC